VKINILKLPLETDIKELTKKGKQRLQMYVIFFFVS